MRGRRGACKHEGRHAGRQEGNVVLQNKQTKTYGKPAVNRTWGVLIHIQMQTMLINIYQYALLVLNVVLYIIYVALAIDPFLDPPDPGSARGPPGPTRGPSGVHPGRPGATRGPPGAQQWSTRPGPRPRPTRGPGIRMAPGISLGPRIRWGCLFIYVYNIYVYTYTYV